MTCPSCKSERCGNHAACARREEAKREAVAKEVARRVVWVAEWIALWTVIARCERVRQSSANEPALLRVMTEAALTMFEPFAQRLYEDTRADVIRAALRGAR